MEIVFGAQFMQIALVAGGMGASEGKETGGVRSWLTIVKLDGRHIVPHQATTSAERTNTKE